MKLVDDWKNAWRWISINCMVIAGALQGAWLYVPEDMRQESPHNLVHAITLILLVCGIFGRIVKQGGENASN